MLPRNKALRVATLALLFGWAVVFARVIVACSAANQARVDEVLGVAKTACSYVPSPAAPRDGGAADAAGE